jgi:hypothetical protein
MGGKGMLLGGMIATLEDCGDALRLRRHSRGYGEAPVAGYK